MDGSQTSAESQDHAVSTIPFETSLGTRPRPSGLPSDHDLTVVIPAYNEESRLPKTLTDAKAYLDQWGIDYRVIVVDDGSKDQTSSLAFAYGPRFSTIRQPNGGKGSAVRRGLLAATGHVVAFTDADLPYDLVSLKSAYETVKAGQADAVFGSRDMTDSASLVERQFLRTLASGVFRGIVTFLVSRQVRDTQCGLKIFSRSAAQAIFSRTKINGFAFDAEAVFLAHCLDLRIQKVPVTLVNEYASTISLSRNAIPMLLDVVRVRWRALRGEYDLKVEPAATDESRPTTRAAA
ncbi:MAG: dolichyl-phosphate beta-glucosyltransferase [Planctomycetota bacterium]